MKLRKSCGCPVGGCVCYKAKEAMNKPKTAREIAKESTAWLMNPLEIDYSDPIGEAKAHANQAKHMENLMTCALEEYANQKVQEATEPLNKRIEELDDIQGKSIIQHVDMVRRLSDLKTEHAELKAAVGPLVEALDSLKEWGGSMVRIFGPEIIDSDHVERFEKADKALAAYRSKNHE